MKQRGREEAGDFDCRHLEKKIVKFWPTIYEPTPLSRPLLVIYEEGLTQTLWFVFINS